MLASAAPRRSSFARSSSLARPCSSGSTTPSAGISNCHARARTKRASSVSSTRESVTGVRIDLDRESRGSTTRGDTRASCLRSNKPRSDLRHQHRSAPVHACTHRARVVTHRLAWDTTHRPSPRFVSARPSVGRRGVAVCARTLHA